MSKEELFKEEILDKDPDDVLVAGDMERALEYMAYFQKKLNSKGYVFCADIQGPFDTAHLVYGDQVFYDIYDDPDFTHHLLKLSTRAIIVSLEAMKEVNGEKRGESYHYNELYMSTGGMKSSEDTTTLIAPDQIKEFSLPYLQECFEAMEGGYVHYCGKNDALFEFAVKKECVRGVNFGNPDMHTYEDIIKMCHEEGKVYYGSWTVNDNEKTYEDYFKRILEPLKDNKKGMIFTCSANLFKKDNDNPYTAEEIVDLWYELQE